MARVCGRRVRVFSRGKKNFVWMGFRAGGTFSNLDTATTFELVPPGDPGDVVAPDMTVVRCVGFIGARNQSGVTAATTAGYCIQKVSFAGDQVTINDQVDSLSTDPDLFSKDGILLWGQMPTSVAASPAADFDEVSQVVAIDVKQKARLNRNEGLELRMDAAVTGRVRVNVSIRVLVIIH